LKGENLVILLERDNLLRLIFKSLNLTKLEKLI
jgi:hypothetical protein